MSAKGMNVLIEGREATVDHIATPHRFALTLSDPIIIGRGFGGHPGTRLRGAPPPDPSLFGPSQVSAARRRGSWRPG